MLDDIASAPFSSIQTRVPHSHFLNEQKYFSIFNTSTGERSCSSDSSSSSKIEVRLRETINSEMISEIEKSGLLPENMDQWQDKVLKHLDDVLVLPNRQTQDTLKERFKKCLVMKCEKCNEVFEGALLASH